MLEALCFRVSVACDLLKFPNNEWKVYFPETIVPETASVLLVAVDLAHWHLRWIFFCIPDGCVLIGLIVHVWDIGFDVRMAKEEKEGKRKHTVEGLDYPRFQTFMRGWKLDFVYKNVETCTHYWVQCLRLAARFSTCRSLHFTFWLSIRQLAFMETSV